MNEIAACDDRGRTGHQERHAGAADHMVEIEKSPRSGCPARRWRDGKDIHEIARQGLDRAAGR